MITPTNMSTRQHRAVQSFLTDSREFEFTPEWACLPTREIRALDIRQIRKAKGLLARAYDPAMDMYYVLTRALSRVYVTPEECEALDRV